MPFFIFAENDISLFKQYMTTLCNLSTFQFLVSHNQNSRLFVPPLQSLAPDIASLHCSLDAQLIKLDCSQLAALTPHSVMLSNTFPLHLIRKSNT